MQKWYWIFKIIITCSYIFEKLEILETPEKRAVTKSPFPPFSPQSKFGVIIFWGVKDYLNFWIFFFRLFSKYWAWIIVLFTKFKTVQD